MVLSGIRPSFPSLSRSTGQITHVLLTRSPLEHPHQGEGLSVRLACVKHAASVRPEPGSNSPKKQTKNKQAKNKETNKTKTNNKHQQLSITIDIHIHVHVHVQTIIRFIKWHTIEFSNNTTTHNPTPKMQSRKQRPHKYTNPTPKPQTPTSQQQKPGKTIQSLLACTLDVTNTGTWAHTSIDIIMVAAKLYAGALNVVSTCSLL